MNHLKMHSLNKIDENVSKIAQLFPNCVTEAKDENGEITHKIDFDMLKQELSTSIVEGREERYQFTWPDKKQAILTANAPINKTLRPCREESVNFDETENLYIEGDNLEVLKLLQETYLGKIKMIYIDPPYNTGNDFVYEDDFAQNADDYIANSGQYDEEGNRLVHNTESNGRFHTDWLNMMYPRLKLARDLLSDDGVIFISIDDNEIENLSKNCNEIYGENNFIGRMTLLSNPRGSQNSKNLSYVHESILMYSKSYDELDIGGIKKSEESLSEFSEKDENGKLYRLLGLRKRGGAWRKEDRPNMFYSIYVNPKNGKCSLNKDSDFCVEVIPKRPTGELSRWTWGKEKFSEEKDKLIGKPINRSGEEDAWDIFRKDYKDNPDGEEKTTKLKTMWIEKETNYQNAKNEIKALFGNSEIFDFPKPTYIVSRLSTIITEEQDIILDFFSGSATTAHAVMQLNAEDGGKRKFIMVQLPELTDEKSEAYKAGYKNICEIGKERIRRAGQLILKQVQNDKEKVTSDLFAKNNKLGVTNSGGGTASVLSSLDVGFRVLKVDSSNMEDIYYSPDDLHKQDLFQDNVKPDRTAEDLLFQVMLDLGVQLSSKIITKQINGKTVYYVNENYLVACFDQEITEETITQIAKEKPYYFVMRDSGFANDSVATNFEQIFTTYSAETVRKVL